MKKAIIFNLVLLVAFLLMACPREMPRKCKPAYNEPPKALTKYFSGYHTVGNYFVYKSNTNRIDCLVVTKLNQDYLNIESNYADRYLINGVEGLLYTNKVKSGKFRIIYSGDEYPTDCNGYKSGDGYADFELSDTLIPKNIFKVSLTSKNNILTKSQLFGIADTSYSFQLIGQYSLGNNSYSEVGLYILNNNYQWIAPEVGIIQKIQSNDTLSLFKYYIQ